MPAKKELIEVAGRTVTVSNPEKVYFPAAGYTKLDLVRYYLAVADGAVRGVKGRPMALKRFVNGIDEPPFFQKRAPTARPDWIETARLAFPSGRTADEIVVRDAAQLAWIVNLGCVDLNPHPVRAEDLDHPDELRIDLDPQPGIAWRQILEVAQVTRAVLTDLGLTSWPKTSGSRGIHVYARVEPSWGFDEVRRAALAVAREVERRAPSLATSKWWKEERHGVFLDYNQNAKDRTVASAYSVRPTPDARVSMPLAWEDLEACDPADFTLATVPGLYAQRGDAHARIDDAPQSLAPLLELAARQEGEGQGDAPWPPHYAKQAGEPARVMPSRARSAGVKAPPRPKMPLVVIAKAALKVDALAGLERWKARHPEAAAKLGPDDVLVDTMRGRFTAWYRIRVNLRNVPEAERPAEEKPDPDYEPTWGPPR
ncbi:MAG: primase small subunit [Labilithrix sp.]|nr:primase small subunit [Labilithrix sp.]